jgi:acyl-CoA thioesterase YciA
MSVSTQIQLSTPTQLLLYEKAYVKVTSHIVLSAHLNAAQSLFGGLLVQWVDECGAIFVMETLKTHQVVTKKISEVLYNEPAHLGDILEICCRIQSVGHTSLTIECVTVVRPVEETEKLRVILNCDLVFVKVDAQGRPCAHHFQLKDENVSKIG